MRRSGALLAAAIVLLLAGCGGGSDETARRGDRPEHGGLTLEPQRLSVTLEGSIGPTNVALPLAETHRYFMDAGLSVAAASPLSQVRAVPYVATGNNDLGIAHLPEVALARQRGAQVVVIGSLVDQPTTSMIWLQGSGIGGLADLRGRTVAVPGLRFQEKFLGSALRRVGLSLEDVDVERVGYHLLPALASGRADAIFGGSANLEGAWLEARGLDPVVLSTSDLGIPPYDELVVISRPDYAERHAATVRRFMAAVLRANGSVEEDPGAAFDAIEGSISPPAETGGRELRREIAATAPLLSADGRVDAARVEALTEWMREEGMLGRKLPASELVADDYLPEP